MKAREHWVGLWKQRWVEEGFFFFSPTTADVRTRENVLCQIWSVCSRCRSLSQTEREKKKKIETHRSGRRFNAQLDLNKEIKNRIFLAIHTFAHLLSLFISFLQLGIHQALWRPLPLKQMKKKSAC